MKKYVLGLFTLMSISANAQNFESILLAADDASQLTENYLNPAVKGLMYTMNGGWYTTAKTHKKLGFDITITASGSFVPDADMFFDFNPNDYAYLVAPNGETSLPTVMSENGSDTVLDVRIPLNDGSGGYKVTSFEMPGGISEDLPINAVPAPMIQVGVGIPFSTDVKFRFVPKMSFDDSVDASLIGFGLQHDLMQYFGVLENLPLNVSVLAAYTNMKVDYNIDDDDISDNVNSTNGKAEFVMNTFTVQALASLDFKIISFYAGLGYNSGKSETNLKGDYELSYDVEDEFGTVVGTVNETISDPIDLDFKANGMRATIGTRLNLGIFKIFGDYTLQEYNTVSVGMAFSFR